MPSWSPGAAEPQQRLGRYRLLQQVGEGGMGVVHLGLDDDARAVAVKVIRPHVAADPLARRRLAREVATLRRVRHPRVAEVLDADPEGAQPYLVTRYVPGPSLEQRVAERGPLPPLDLARLGDGLGEALAAIHDAGVVHRDLKPANVLLLDDEPVVIDFGIAHVADDVRLTSTGLVMGTPGYLSPEVLAGEAATEATDWWGWAATVAFAGTGRPPFGRGPSEAVLDRVRRGQADLGGLPAVLLEPVAAALAVSPADRPVPGVLRVAVAELRAQALRSAARDDMVTQAVAARRQDFGQDGGARVAGPAAGGVAGSAGAAAASAGVAAAGAAAASRPAAADHDAGHGAADDARVGDAQRPRTAPTQAVAGPATGDETATQAVPQPEPRTAATAQAAPESGSSSSRSAPAAAASPAAAPGSRAPRPGGAADTGPVPVTEPVPAPGGRAPAGPHGGAAGSQQPSVAQVAGSPTAKHPAREQATQAYPAPPPGTSPAAPRSAPSAPPTRPTPPPPRPVEPAARYVEPAARYADVGETDEPADRRGGRGWSGPSPARSGTLLAAALTLCLVAAVVPVLAAVAGFAAMVLARTVDRSTGSLLQRRYERGPRRGDAVLAALRSPFHLVGAALVSLPAMLLPALVGVSTAFATGWLVSGGNPVPGDPVALAAGAAAAVALAWWGPGGTSLRRGSRSVARALTPGRRGAQLAVALLVLLAVAAALVVSGGADPDWTPLPGPPLG